MDDEERIRRDVLSIVQTYGKVRPPVVADRDLYTEVGIKSVDAVSILLAIESRFHISIDDDHFAGARTVNGLVDLLLSHPLGTGSRVA
ncbi:MAG: acyl carrier protein [Gammaproteobacteria bacterium]|nr:acyl carrier protein [Gammaproteobacteria bacterium]